jgi:hypothetical protein
MAIPALQGDMAGRGRPRKNSGRQRNGRLRYTASPDRGQESVLDQRARPILGADPHNHLAGFPSGILELRGDYADPSLRAEMVAKKCPEDAILSAMAEQNYARARAGDTYSRIHAIFWNGFPNRPNPETRSCMASMIAGVCEPLSYLAEDDRAKQHRRCGKQLNEIISRMSLYGPLPLYALDEIFLYQHRMGFMDSPSGRPLAAERFFIAAVRQALAALVIEFR